MSLDKRIDELRKQFNDLAKTKSALLDLISEAEVSEMVFNSNAIENSTLTLEETEKVLLEIDLARYVSARELFEAKNLARIIEYTKQVGNRSLVDYESILILHRMLLTGIDDEIAGRIRQGDEFVRIGKHIAPDPQKVSDLLNKAILEYKYSNLDPIESIALFHLEFERIHPFCDGNGRTGRVIMNIQLNELNMPPVIIRNKEKYGLYYPYFDKYNSDRSMSDFVKVVKLYVSESLNKRIAYLSGQEIIRLSEYAKKSERSLNALINSAKRQTIPAFRQNEVWMIGN